MGSRRQGRRHGIRGVLASCALFACTTAILAQPVTVDFGDRWVAADEPLVLRVDAGLHSHWRDLRVFLGSSDVSALLHEVAPGVLELVPVATSWAAGEGELVLYGGDWSELARLPVRVLGRDGLEQRELNPSMDLQLEGRAAEDRSDGEPVSPRGTYSDVAGRGGLAWSGTRSGWQLGANANLVGSSNREQALRYGELASTAPKVDLADYRLSLARGGFGLEAGHLGAGTHPLLAQGLASRGLGMRSRLGTRADLSLHMLSGTAIVGWDNFLGLAESENRTQLLTLGVELLGQRPGGLRAELSLLDASLLSRADFNTGMVPDAEESRGLGLRILGQSQGGRLRGEVALARSRFTNPYDPALALDGELREVQPVTRNALSAEMQLGLLQQAPFAGHGLDLTLVLRFDHAAPLYRSLAAFVNSDQEATRAGLQGSLAGATFSLQAAQRVDNLDRIATLLRTRTDELGATLSLPLAAWLGSDGAPAAWPSLTWGWQQVHQRAANAPIPEESGFAASQRPDQVSRSHQLSLGWTLPSGSLSYGLSLSEQDNRQPGRERADFQRVAHQLSLSWTFGASLSTSIGVHRSRQYSVETDIASYLTGGMLTLDWRASDRWALSMSAAHDFSSDSLDNASTRDLNLQAQATWRFDVAGLRRPLPGQVFLRVASQGQRQRDNTFDFNAEFDSWWIDFGFSMGFF